MNCGGSEHLACELWAGYKQPGFNCGGPVNNQLLLLCTEFRRGKKKLRGECFLVGGVAKHPVWWFHPCYTQHAIYDQKKHMDLNLHAYCT
jgi:hypothetical protein